MRRGWSRCAVGAVAVGLLAGCTGGADTGGRRADTAQGPGPGARPPGSAGGAPAPGYQEGREQGRGAEGAEGDEGDEGGNGEGAEPKPSSPADFRSTFALDVDTASYGYAKRTVRAGSLPAPATVRTEEFVNSFEQGYQRPRGDGFSVSADGARTGDDWALMRIGLATERARVDGPRKPAALTFVLDVSGSMGEPGRLDLVKDALRTASKELRAKDSVALVTFSDRAETVLPMTRMGDGGRKRLRDAVGALESRSSTNLGAGVKEGYAQAAEHRRAGATNRVVLLSDALANTGRTGASQILADVASHRRKYGITLFGVGVGSQYGDALMERLTNKGDGHTAYISSEEEAREVFVEQLPRHIGLRARDAKAQVAFDPRTVERFRLLGYENRAVADEDFRNDRVDGGEVGPGHTVTALYAVQLKKGARGRAATATVRWLDPDSKKPHEKARTVQAATLTGAHIWAKSGKDDKSASPRLRLTAVAAYFADFLRARGSSDTPSAAPRVPGAPSLDTLRAHAGRVARETGDRQATELADVIALARRLG